MNISNLPYANFQPQTTGEQQTVAGSAVQNKAELSYVNAASTRANDQSLARDNPEQGNKTNKETLSASEYEMVAAAHKKNQTIYDNPQGNQRLAISSYQSVLHAPKREEIQRLVGIDTYA